MASILHGNATTTPRIRKEIQNSSASISELAKIYHLTPKTIRKWGKRLKQLKMVFPAVTGALVH